MFNTKYHILYKMFYTYIELIIIKNRIETYYNKMIDAYNKMKDNFYVFN